MNLYEIFIFVLSLSYVKSQALPTSSPDTEFVSFPTNNTVLEGTPAILKCKIRQPIHSCQWFYLEAGLSFYDSANAPVLVKEFRPAGGSDCSIKFNKTRRVQNGQWLCKGLNVPRRTYIVSRPAYLKIITRQEDMPSTTASTPVSPETENEVKFKILEDGHLINTGLSQSVPLKCQINREIQQCSWMTPTGKKISNSSGLENYQISDMSPNGTCELGISDIRPKDEGNWRCVVSLVGEAGERLGPIIHLHILEFGSHHTGVQHINESDSQTRPSLVMPLVAISLLLVCLLILVALIVYKKAPHLLGCKSSDENNDASSVPEYKTDHTGTAIHKLDPSYSASYLSSPAVLQPSVQQEAAVPNHYTRYLDMTGQAHPRPGSYVSFPPSPFRSPSTATTATIVSSPHGSSFAGSTGNNSLTGSNRSVPSFESVSYDANPSMDPVPLYNGSHLYEEIDEKNGRLGGRRQSYPSEDPEGYMMPKNLSRQPGIPPLPADYQNDPRRSTNSLAEENRRGRPYDQPPEPPLPIRGDSVVNPLASYDVPNGSRNSAQNLGQVKSVLV